MYQAIQSFLFPSDFKVRLKNTSILKDDDALLDIQDVKLIISGMQHLKTPIS